MSDDIAEVGRLMELFVRERLKIQIVTDGFPGEDEDARTIRVKLLLDDEVISEDSLYERFYPY